MVPAHLVRSKKFEVRSSKSTKGFSLVELLIVIGVIGVLATISFVVINPLSQLQKARDSRRKTDLANVQKALELYYNDNNSYPPNDARDFVIELADGTNVLWGQSWQEDGVTYMDLPRDPNHNSGTRYRYQRENDGQGYRLYAALERCQGGSVGCYDSQACRNGLICFGVSPMPIGGIGGCGGPNTCTYGVAGGVDVAGFPISP